MSTSEQVHKARETNPAGRWGVAHYTDRWESTGTVGYADRADAEAEVAWLNTIHPGRWRVRDRRVVS